MNKDEILVELKALEEQVVNILCYTFQKESIKNKIMEDMEAILILILNGQYSDADKKMQDLSFELDNLMTRISRSEKDKLITKEKLTKTTYTRFTNEIKKYCDIEIMKLKQQMELQMRLQQETISQQILENIEKGVDITPQSILNRYLKDSDKSLIQQLNKKLQYYKVKSSKDIFSQRYLELLDPMKDIDWPETRDELISNLSKKVNGKLSNISIGAYLSTFKKIGIIDYNRRGKNLKLTNDGSKLLKLLPSPAKGKTITPPAKKTPQSELHTTIPIKKAKKKRAKKDKSLDTKEKVKYPPCKHCNSPNTGKYGTDKTGKKVVQVYKCKSCKRTFFGEEIKLIRK